MLPIVTSPPSPILMMLDGAGAISPTDGSTYYMGGLSAAGVTTSANIRRFYIPTSGVIKKAHVYFLNPGTLGTEETSSIYIRKNNTNDFLISDQVVNNAISVHLSKTDMSVSVNAGDYIEIKWVCPTWATNPTSVRYYVHLELQP